MKELCILSNNNPSREWNIRNRLGDLNFRLRDKQISLAQAVELASIQAWRWQQIEPLTDFIVSLEEGQPCGRLK